jgi:hypothetical protein
MGTASNYGFVLWAIPRFRRAETGPRSPLPKTLKPASGVYKAPRSPATAAPPVREQPEPVGCLRFAH